MRGELEASALSVAKTRRESRMAACPEVDGHQMLTSVDQVSTVSAECSG